MDKNSGARRSKPGVGRQTGGIAPLLALAVPALVAAGKASALGGVSAAASYGTKKVLDIARRKAMTRKRHVKRKHRYTFSVLNKQMTGCMSSQAAFLKSVFNEAKLHKRQQQLRHANTDQINVSELVMNTICGAVPQERQTLRRLKPYAKQLPVIANPWQSIKRPRGLMMHQLGGSVWQELRHCYHCGHKQYHC